MKALDLAEKLANDGYFDDLIDEQYWNKDFRASKHLELLKDYAEKNLIKLDKLEDFDYEDYFYELYSITEKGLS